ncbi:MAG TPA: hypothetical protein VGM69_20520 [Chloroflexota bacterium]
MAFEETVWFVPLDAQTGALQSIYQTEEPPADAPGVISAGRAFTVSVEAMSLARRPSEPWYQRMIHPQSDVLILTSSALGSKPLIERVHFYKTDVAPDQPLRAHDLLSDVIWVCDDYQGGDAFYLELQVVMINRSDEQREAILRGFQTLATTAGAIFPVVLPYAALGEGVLTGIAKLWDTASRQEIYPISEPLRLFPPRTPRAKTIRPGRYVILSEAIDGSTCQLGESLRLTTQDGGEPVGKDGDALSYAVLRIDPTKDVLVDFVISQRVATLLTQLKNDREGQSAGALQTSLGFLTDTLKSYTSFKDLQRYRELLGRGDARTPGETEQMHRLEERDELTPFLPKPPG